MKKEIIAWFKKNPGARVKSKKLAQEFFIIDEHDYAALKAQLHTLIEEGVLTKDGKRYALLTAQNKNTMVGTIQVTRDGFGFVIPDSKKIPDVFVAERNLHSAMNGDRVEIIVYANQKRKAKNLEGEVIKIIKRKFEVLAGILRETKSGWRVIPERNGINQKIVITAEDAADYADGDRVIVGDLLWVAESSAFSGKILKKAGGEGMTLDDEYMTIMSEYGLNPAFPLPVMQEAAEMKMETTNEEIARREDFRNEIVMTIDPVDAKDFDDALSIKTLENGNYKIGIHIADVSHYVTRGSELDREAERRGNSVYLVGKVVPMLPEVLSNGICSLVPNEDRFTYSCIVEMTPRGKLVDYHFAKSVINSKRRFAYAEVQQIIVTKKGDYAEQVLLLHKIANLLRAKRMKSGSVNFHSSEVKIFLDEANVPVRMEKEASDDSHNLVEEFMLLANKLVATYIKEKVISGHETSSVYRIHDRPDPEKLHDFVNLLKTIGYNDLPSSDKMKPKDLNSIIERVTGKPEETLVNSLAVRAMAKAVYSPKNIGHYGLGFPYYTHFTSPIRRYSDLLAHRILHGVQQKDKKSLYSYSMLESVCEHISFTERNAAEAERATKKLKQVQFMKAFVGEEFDALISGVTNFGIFVEVLAYLSEGLIRMADLTDDYYLYDEKKYSIIGRKTKRVFRLGDPVRVKLIRVDEIKQELDFIMVDGSVA